MFAAAMQTRAHAVLRRRDLGGGTYAVEVAGPIPATQPGQFFMLRTAERWPVLLPRPFSLYDCAPDGSWGSFLIKPIGDGTRALCDLEPGERIVCTGPLGRSFPLDIADPVCVAGGVGLAPFLLLARHEHAHGRRLRLLFGGRDRSALAGIDDFAAIAQVAAATDDGSHGHRGMITSLLQEQISRGTVRSDDVVFCCGPDPMMHAVAALCERHQRRCFLSLETYMACGYGVCNGCTVAVRGERFHGWPYSRTCIEGPVYEACELAELHT